MPDADDIAAIEDAIAANGAAGISSATVDGNSVSKMRPQDQAFAADRAAQSQATDARQFFMHRTRLIPAARQ